MDNLEKTIRKAVFLDRDGVINRDSADYVKSLDEFVLIPGSISAISKLSGRGYAVFVVTNQSALARNYIDPAGLEEIHEYLREAVRNAGGEIRGIYFCPHHPDEGCECRKPKTGLIERAASEHGIDVSSAVMIGDKQTDIQCARNAGCKRAYWVATGLGGRPDESIKRSFGNFCKEAKNLDHAVDLLIGDENAGE